MTFPQKIELVTHASPIQNLLYAKYMTIPGESMKKIRFLGITAVLIIALLVAGCTEEDNGEEKPERDPAPTFSLPDLDDNSVKLTSYYGKVVILDFMFMDCDPCIDEMEELDDVHSNYDESDVQIISIDIIDTEQERSDLISHIENNSYEWKFVIDTKNIKNSYDVGTYPTLFLIDKEGKIAHTHVGKTSYSTLSSELDKLLDE
jgi:peroxiredoxin